MAEPTWQELVDVARWAPSPHNMQPWKVRVRSATEAELMADPARLLPETDPDGAFMTVGLGIFVEMLAIAAHARGQEVDVELVGEVDPRVAGLSTFARLRLLDRRIADALSPRLVLERRTSRVAYDGRPVDPRVLDELGEIASTYGHRLESASDPALVDWVLELNRETLFFDLTDEVARREVGAWLRFSAAEAARRADGFSPTALGFPGWLLRAYFGAAGVFELPGLRSAIRALYGRTMRGTRTVGWIAGPWGGRDEWFASGRILARLWLTMTMRGVVLHPFGSVITNPAANARLQERIPVADGTLWLLFRAGYSTDPPRSHRLEPTEVLVA
jgi:hypothetical protein